jgi:hypothetical protein
MSFLHSSVFATHTLLVWYGSQLQPVFAQNECIPGLDSGCVYTPNTGGSHLCTRESEFKSINFDRAVGVRFQNETMGAITIYWLDSDGKRKIYNTVRSGDGASYQTYVTNPWVITDSQGNCLLLYLPTENPNQFVSVIEPPQK